MEAITWSSARRIWLWLQSGSARLQLLQAQHMTFLCGLDMVMKYCVHKNKAEGNNWNRDESVVGVDLGVKSFWGKSLQITRIKAGKCLISERCCRVCWACSLLVLARTVQGFSFLPGSILPLARVWCRTAQKMSGWIGSHYRRAAHTGLVVVKPPRGELCNLPCSSCESTAACPSFSFLVQQLTCK